MAGIYARAYGLSNRQPDKESAIQYADEALAVYDFLKQHVEPTLNQVYGKHYNQLSRDLDGILADEREDRRTIGVTFKWPEDRQSDN